MQNAAVLDLRARHRSPALLVAGALIAFIGVLAFRSAPADPETRLPGRYRLADLIEAQQSSAAKLRSDVAGLRAEIAAERAASASRSGGSAEQAISVQKVESVAGLVAMTGPGIKVSLDDSRLDAPPAGAGVNDLVVHSQDVQAVVNALWRAGAEAVAINGQRLVSTSAVLCVGNTLLLNGTVHSPPYVVSAIGATRDRFDTDRLVRRLKADSSAFGLTFTVERQTSLQVPAYRGSTTLTYARPAS
jgi:uncharacterized protein YlxW (UPF0749 family)